MSFGVVFYLKYAYYFFFLLIKWFPHQFFLHKSKNFRVDIRCQYNIIHIGNE